jgi:hypothetical protein
VEEGFESCGCGEANICKVSFFDTCRKVDDGCSGSVFDACRAASVCTFAEQPPGK